MENLSMIWHFAVFLAFFTKGIAGFANTLVHSGIMAFFTDHTVITPVDLLLNLPANLIYAFRNHQRIQPRLCLTVGFVVMLSMIPGVFLLRTLNSSWLKIAFGVLIIALALNMLRTRKGNAGGRSLVSWLLILLSGLVTGMFGVSALLVPALERLTDDSSQLKANLAIIFFLNNLVQLVLYLATGILTSASLLQVVKLVPAMLAGLLTGMHLARSIPEKKARRIVILALLLSGLMLIISNLHAL